MPGKRFNSQARNLVANRVVYFTAEKENDGPLIPLNAIQEVSYLIVDEMHHEHPELIRDQYWDDVFPQELPYNTPGARESHPLPSTANIAPQFEPVIAPSSYKDDNMLNDLQSGPITFSAKPGMRSVRGSQTSIGNSVPDHASLSRVNSVAGKLKRFFSREEPRMDDLQELNNVAVKPDSLRKITDQIIEEVDEQTTINSQRGINDPRPSVLNVFGPPTPSEPISVPNTNHRSVYDPYPFPLSASAPTQGDEYKDCPDNLSIGKSESEPDDELDAFAELKKKRDEERLNRIKTNLMRSVSTIPNEDIANECASLLIHESSVPSSPKSK